MKITLKRTPEQIELVKAMASRNRTVAYEAQVALAEFIGPVLAEVINNAPTISNLFTSLQFNADDNPSIPLDLYYDINDEDYVKVYSQSHAGGLPTNQVLPTASELKVATYSLDTAVSFDRRYAAKSRMDVVSKTFTRVAQEILAKQETTSASLVMGSLADAETNSTKHVRASSTASGKRFLLDDINKMMTLSKRINGSFLGGTPAAGQARGITDLIVSPEVVEELARWLTILSTQKVLLLVELLLMVLQLLMSFVTLFTILLDFLSSTASPSWRFLSLELARSSLACLALLLEPPTMVLLVMVSGILLMILL